MHDSLSVNGATAGWQRIDDSFFLRNGRRRALNACACRSPERL
jgi:hypothetical protein